jgi:hypothetical protein
MAIVSPGDGPIITARGVSFMAGPIEGNVRDDRAWRVWRPLGPYRLWQQHECRERRQHHEKALPQQMERHEASSFLADTGLRRSIQRRLKRHWSVQHSSIHHKGLLRDDPARVRGHAPACLRRGSRQPQADLSPYGHQAYRVYPPHHGRRQDGMALMPDAGRVINAGGAPTAGTGQKNPHGRGDSGVTPPPSPGRGGCAGRGRARTEDRPRGTFLCADSRQRAAIHRGR